MTKLELTRDTLKQKWPFDQVDWTKDGALFWCTVPVPDEHGCPAPTPLVGGYSKYKQCLWASTIVFPHPVLWTDGIEYED
jgi:hypothetical protein